MIFSQVCFLGIYKIIILILMRHVELTLHDIITGKWMPTSDDIQKGRLPGPGASLGENISCTSQKPFGQ